MIRKCFICFLLVAVACGFLACSENDMQAPVYSDIGINDVVPSVPPASTPIVAEGYRYPKERLKEHLLLFDGHLEIQIDTDIFMPSVSIGTRNATRKTFTSQQFESFVNLIGNEKMLYYESPQDKAYWEKALAAAQAGWVDINGELSIDRDYVAYCNDMLENAPITAMEEPFAFSDFQAGQAFACDIRFDDGSVGSVGITEDNMFYYKRDRDIVSNLNRYTIESEGFSMPEIDIDAGAAIAIADQVVAALGADDLVFDNVAERAVVHDQSDVLLGIQRVIYVKTCDGLKTYDTGTSFQITPRSWPAYGAPWPQERLEICVDTNGIVSVDWNGMTELLPDWRPTTLLPFDKLKPLVIEKIALFSPFAVNQQPYYGANVYHWRLGTSLTSIDSERDVGAMIPTWYISYHETAGLAEDDRSSKMNQDRIIAFNAIDGTYIDPRVTTEIMSQRAARTQQDYLE